MSNVAIIDFEASCLPDDGESFPIEVALAVVGGPSQSWLIKPSWHWRYWSWSDEAEALHGISRTMLQSRGLPARQVLAELAHAAAGLDIYTDADLDAYWLEVLCLACQAPLPFKIRYLGELFQTMELTPPAVSSAEKAALTRLPMAHVARKDAQRLALTVQLLSS
ncbi:hypothetical protein C1T17_11155 [Sphingobium sp. SCG-1]|nr:hypothetical protein C1T17_11155 [Sphingobium sp. SCG-1]